MLSLLSFTGVSCLAEEPFKGVNCGRIWNSWSNSERNIFLMGTASGMIKCIDDFYNSIGFHLILIKLNHDEKLSKLLTLSINENNDFLIFFSENRKVIKNAMDDLYKDPANTYIPFRDICYLAYQKLKGEDIEPLLREARKKHYLKINLYKQ